MPINELIARGVRPIGADLPELYGLLRQQKEQERRNRLIDEQLKREGEGRNALSAYLQNPSDQTFGGLAQADPYAAAPIYGQRQEQQEQEQSKQAWLAAMQVANSPSPKQAAMQFPQAIEELRQNGVDFDSLNDDQVRQLSQQIAEYHGQRIGIQRQSPGQLYRTGPQGIYRTAEQAIGQPAFNDPGQSQQPPSGYRWGAEGALEAIPGGPADPSGPGSRRNTQPLRKEFRTLPSVRDYETALPIFESAKKAPDTGYGDLQLIYTVGKLLDPNSVVREGELALTIAAGSPLQRIIGSTRFTIEKGGRLPPKSRAQIMEMLQERIGAYEQAYNRDYQQFSEYATELGVDPSLVVGKPAKSAYDTGKGKAPAAAIEYLRNNPQFKGAFKAKYGYLPEGI